MPSHFRKGRLGRTRGALLIVALLLAAIIGLSLVSFIKLSSTTLQLSSRSFLDTSALNLTETGLEYALLAVNQNQTRGVPLETAWSGWSVDSVTKIARRSFPDSGNYALAPSASGVVKVAVLNYDLSGTPTVVARATVATGADSPPLSRFIEVQLSRRSIWSFGLVAKNALNLKSNATVDSWISDEDGDPATPAVAFTAARRRDRGSAAVVAAADGALALASNAEIYGSAHTGGGTVSTGSNVRIRNAASAASPKVDASLVHRDFTFTFPPIAVPAPAVVNWVVANWNNSVTLPRTGDLPVDGVYYYRFASGKVVDLDSNRTLRVNQPVVFLFQDHDGVASFKLSSNANLVVAAGKSVTLHTNGHVHITGNNNLNVGNDARQFVIYGNGPGGQQITFDSNVTVYGCIYAPNAAITMNSNNQIHGSVIGASIQLDSNAAFHFDESLARAPGSGGFRVSKWKELRTPAERAVHAGTLAF